MPPEDAGPAVADPAAPLVFAPASAPQVMEIPWTDGPADQSDPFSVLFGEATLDQQKAAQAAKEAAAKAAPPAETTPPAQASAPPAEPPKPEAATQPPASDARPDATVPTGDPAPRDLSDEEVEELARNPKLAARIERLAANRAGNLLDQGRKAEEAWNKAVEANNGIEALGQSTNPEDQVKYRTLLGDPEVAAWRAQFLTAKAQREQAASAPAGVQDRDALLQDFNEGAAKEFASIIAKTPWYSEFPAGLRTRIEGAQQANTKVTWLEEWVGDYVAETEKYWKGQVKAAADAARADAQASGAPANPPRVPEAGASQDLNANDIINRHAFFGHNMEAGGVTTEQLTWAKAQKGFDY